MNEHLCHIHIILYSITIIINVMIYMYVFLQDGLRLFYLCIGLYLYGDLAIYAAAVPKSLTNISWYVQVI